MMNDFRPPAVPLLVFDPYFSVWSFADKLYEEPTRHWTGAKNAMVGMVRCGDNVWRFMGKLADREYYYCEPDVIEQTNVRVNPTVTEYTFENDKLKLIVRFINPLVVDDLKLLSRPVGYIEYEAFSKSNEDIEVYFDISAEVCVDDYLGQVKLFKGEAGIYCGNIEQKLLNKSGDNVRIDWGYLHLLEKEAYFCNAFTGRNEFVLGKCDKKFNAGDVLSVYADNPAMAVIKKGNSGRIAIAYDDIKSLEYFGKQLDAYYKIEGEAFEDICLDAVNNFEKIKEKCIAFDNKLISMAERISDKYKDIISLSYRQAIAAHKLCFDEKSLVFISKECFSNGCAATVDITYPSMPLFLILNPELVKGMLRPMFEFAGTDLWGFEFAPHDVGTYPIIKKQVYGYEKDDPEWILNRQMPIEECANMLLCTYALCEATGSKDYACQNKELLIKWGEYLLKHGKNPGNQLCTDDFGGHLDKNCNLSVKAIVGLYACGILFDIDEYVKKAEEYALWWKENAKENDHYKLAFDTDDSWSIKYNMVWDKIFDFGLFSDVFKKETDFYMKKLTRYGIPLDSRGLVGKNDWIMWAAAMCDSVEKRDAIVESVWNMINETKTRVPVTDYYDIETGMQHRWAEYYTWNGFQNRSVVGGFGILMM